MREREAKLVVDEAFEPPAVDRVGKRRVTTRVETIEQHAVYYDTDDLRLTRAGASLRFRSDDAWTVKLPERRDGSQFVRSEHTFAGDPHEPPDGALDLVQVHARGEPVHEIARIDTRRRRTELIGDGGRVLAECDDDRVSGRANGETRRFREIEIELAEDTPDRVLDALVAAFREAGARPGPAASKVERVLGSRARKRPDVPTAQPLGKQATVGEVVRDTFARALHQIAEYDAGLRTGGGDVEAVHKTRVATRRLRSDLRTLRPLLDRAWSDRIRDELKWLGEVLGHVRDADVLHAALEEKLDRLPEDHAGAARGLTDELRRSRAREHDVVLEALRSRRYAELLDALVDGAARPRLARGVKPDTRARKRARKLAHRSGRRVRREVRGISGKPRDADLHEVRKRAKRARYAHEAFAPLLGKPASRAAKRFEAVQEVLGSHQDAVVATSWLRSAAHDREDRDEAFVAGELAGLFVCDREAARHEWPAVWKHAERAEV